MTEPNFIIIGANKGGTTSLYKYLSQHPEVFMSPIKEPTFFSLYGVNILDRRRPDHKMAIRSGVITDEAKYFSLFDGATDEKAVGEASTGYLPTPQAAGLIHSYLPDAKIIAILRNPVERAYSNYLMYLRSGLEKNFSFEEAIRRTSKTEYGNHNIYVDLGFYRQQLGHYLKYFEREQLAVYLYDDLKNDAVALIQNIFTFLGIDHTFVPDVSTKYNSAPPIVRSRSLKYIYESTESCIDNLSALLPEGVIWRARRLLMSAKKRNLMEKNPTLSADARQYLINIYRDDVINLQEFVGRDLSHWLK